MPQSRMKTTSKNFLTASLIAFAAMVVLTVVYSCMAWFANFNANQDNGVALLDYLSQSFLSVFKFVGLCFAPVVLLISFALLQRFRIKN